VSSTSTSSSPKSALHALRSFPHDPHHRPQRIPQGQRSSCCRRDAARVRADRARGNRRWDKAPCRFCGTGCHVQVGVRNDGKVVAIAGDRQADVNKGLLCVKGYHVGLALYGQDRLTHPMLRKNGGRARAHLVGRGARHHRRPDQARPGGFAFYGSGQWTIPEGYAAQKFMKGGPLEQPHRPQRAALHGVGGDRVPPRTASTSRRLLPGPRRGRRGHPVGQQPGRDAPRPVLADDRPPRARRAGALIDIGTRRTRTTGPRQRLPRVPPHGTSPSRTASCTC
jgi:nitrate reductase NapA